MRFDTTPNPKAPACIDRSVIESCCSDAALLRRHPSVDVERGLFMPSWHDARARVMSLVVAACGGALAAVRIGLLGVVVGVGFGALLYWLFRRANRGHEAELPLLQVERGELTCPVQGWRMARDRVAGFTLAAGSGRMSATGGAPRAFVALVVHDAAGASLPVCATLGLSRFLQKAATSFAEHHGIPIQSIELEHTSWPSADLLRRFAPPV